MQAAYRLEYTQYFRRQRQQLRLVGRQNDSWETGIRSTTVGSTGRACQCRQISYSSDGASGAGVVSPPIVRASEEVRVGNLKLDQSVFEASADAAEEWGAIRGGASLKFDGNVSARRGIDIDLGLMAIVNLDASFSQYLAADLSGQAQAQASIRGQIQLPINLFDEIGVAVRLQAIAEVAAGVRLGLAYCSTTRAMSFSPFSS